MKMLVRAIPRLHHSLQVLLQLPQSGIDLYLAVELLFPAQLVGRFFDCALLDLHLFDTGK